MKSELLKIKLELIKSVEENTDNIINTLESLNSQIESKIETKKSLQKEIDDFSIIHSLLIENRKKEYELKLDLEKILRLIKIKETELIDLDNKQSLMISDFDNKINKSKNELNDLTISLEEKRKTLFPTMSSLREREKILANRESDMEIIIERYKKLYAKLGRTFRI